MRRREDKTREKENERKRKRGKTQKKLKEAQTKQKKALLRMICFLFFFVCFCSYVVSSLSLSLSFSSFFFFFSFFFCLQSKHNIALFSFLSLFRSQASQRRKRVVSKNLKSLFRLFLFLFSLLGVKQVRGEKKSRHQKPQITFSLSFCLQNKQNIAFFSFFSLFYSFCLQSKQKYYAACHLHYLFFSLLLFSLFLLVFFHSFSSLFIFFLSSEQTDTSCSISITIFSLLGVKQVRGEKNRVVIKNLKSLFLFFSLSFLSFRSQASQRREK